ncbi:hypothetical protein IGI37_000209 [Enterococcus sp. AZ194]|uniref:hypothetical protein n=1 Tax=Enterococcus sp. AZ194 TaxID=2774629 RepID=UPI003F22096C
MKSMNRFVVILFISSIFLMLFPSSSSALSMVPEDIRKPSPFSVQLSLEGFVSKVTFKNESDETVFVDKSLLGVKAIPLRVFSKTTGYSDLTLYNSFTIGKENYISIKPDEEIMITTNLEQYYDFT